jgi:hypothetical protein
MHGHVSSNNSYSRGRSLITRSGKGIEAFLAEAVIPHRSEQGESELIEAIQARTPESDNELM